MIDKIIIDGVNVAGCMDYKEVEYKEMPICMNYYNHLPKPPKETEWQYCAGNKNCYYKQRKRLEQENKELKAYKDVNEDFKKAWNELNEKYKQLRSALEEIKKTIKSYDLAVDNGASVDTLYTIRKIINEVLK